MNNQLSEELRNKALEYLTNNFIPVNDKIKKIGWWLVVAGLIASVGGFFILKAKNSDPGTDNKTDDEPSSKDI